MVVDGDVGKDDSAGVRKQVYFIQEHKPKLELPTTKVDNCALAIVWNVAFEKADYVELTV